MMGKLIEQIATRGQRAAANAVSRLADALVEVAKADIQGVEVTRERDRVLLTAPQLRARAFGTRSRAADPRLAGLIYTFKSWSALL